MVVIGGGLAGITAAIALAESGAQVTLLEARPRLGGATCSFARDALTVDTGQHIYLGCCTAYRGLLDKLGMTGHAPLQRRFDVTVLAPGGRRARLRRTALPGPLHMLPALTRYAFLSLAERALVSRPALAMRALDPADPALDAQRFGDWLAARGQDERARRALWDLFTVSALNIAGDDASLALAATVVKTGLLGKNNAADIGVPALPLGELHGDAGAALLAKLGAQVHLNAKVTAVDPMSLERNGDVPHAIFRVCLARPTGTEGAGDATELTADAVVLAVPHEVAARLIPRSALPSETVERLGRARRLAHRQRARDLRPPGDGPPVRRRRRLPGPVGLRPHRDLRPEPLRDRPAVPGDLALGGGRVRGRARRPAPGTLRPRAGRAVPRRARGRGHRVLRHARAPGDLPPGARQRRAPPAGRRPRLPGLVLAGAWTDTGWPDTMESAVRSGLAAAIELRHRTFRARNFRSRTFPCRIFLPDPHPDPPDPDIPIPNFPDPKRMPLPQRWRYLSDCCDA